MTEIQIVVPTMGRAGAVYAHEVFGPENVILCPPERERDAYAKAYPDVEIVAHPDTVVGISQKRQWIYDLWRDVVMIDDDTAGIAHLEHAIGEKPCLLAPDEAVYLCERLADESREYGAYLFGVHSTIHPLGFKVSTPFRTTGWVNAGFTGLLAGSKLAYHPGIVCSEDFWISALNAHHHRKVWVDTRYGVLDKSKGTGTMNTPGGMAATRSLEAQARDNEILDKYFGPAIQSRTGHLVKAKHDLQVKLALPY